MNVFCQYWLNKKDIKSSTGKKVLNRDEAVCSHLKGANYWLQTLSQNSLYTFVGMQVEEIRVPWKFKKLNLKFSLKQKLNNESN